MTTRAPKDGGSSAHSGEVTIRLVEDPHAHDVTINVADLESGNRVTYTSSVASEHSHAVTLTPEIISDLNAGATRTILSDPDATGHTHEWVLRDPEAARARS